MGKGIINQEEVYDFSKRQIELGGHIDAMIRSEGWRVFLAVFRNKKRDIQQKEDYTSLEDFQVDRRAVKMVDAIITDLKSYVDDAGSAKDLITQLDNKAANQTPEYILALDTEDEDVAEG